MRFRPVKTSLALLVLGLMTLAASSCGSRVLGTGARTDAGGGGAGGGGGASGLQDGEPCEDDSRCASGRCETLACCTDDCETFCAPKVATGPVCCDTCMGPTEGCCAGDICVPGVPYGSCVPEGTSFGAACTTCACDTSVADGGCADSCTGASSYCDDGTSPSEDCYECLATTCFGSCRDFQ